MTEPLIRLCNDDGLEISYAPGSGENAVVSFAGVGLNYGGMQTEEFSKSLASSTNDVYYVKDKLRHWYFECADKIVEVLNRSLEDRNSKSATCIGNSMGGFGAIYFAPRLHNCANAIAFVPQSSVNTRIVPWESRWMEWRSSLAPGNGLDAAKSLDARVSYTTVIGLQNRPDILHLRRLVNKGRDCVTAIGLPDSGHGVAGHLKRHGALQPLLLSLLAGQKYKALAALRDVPHEIVTRKNVEGFLKAARGSRD